MLYALLHFRQQPDASIPVAISLHGDISVNQDILPVVIEVARFFQFQGSVYSPQCTFMPPLVEMRKRKWGFASH